MLDLVIGGLQVNLKSCLICVVVSQAQVQVTFKFIL